METMVNAGTMLDSGLNVSFGSDGPYYWPIDPLRDVRFAVERTSRRGRALSPHESIPLPVALEIATAGAAWLGRMEDELGYVEEGYLADLVVFDAWDPRDLLAQSAVHSVYVGRSTPRREFTGT